MREVFDHYTTVLNHHYSLMIGDFDEAVQSQIDLMADLDLVPRGSGRALDLGCGSGLHSLALAGLGFRVRGVDLSADLLDELRRRPGGKDVEVAAGDLRDFETWGDGLFEVITCLGDTPSHLPDVVELHRLVESGVGRLEPGGVMMLGFRNQERALEGVERIIPVVRNDHLIWTCFLEYTVSHVKVHDVIDERTEDGRWLTRKGAYWKLRLTPSSLDGVSKKLGLNPSLTRAPGGMVLASFKQGKENFS